MHLELLKQFLGLNERRKWHANYQAIHLQSTASICILRKLIRLFLCRPGVKIWICVAGSRCPVTLASTTTKSSAYPSACAVTSSTWVGMPANKLYSNHYCSSKREAAATQANVGDETYIIETPWIYVNFIYSASSDQMALYFFTDNMATTPTSPSKLRTSSQKSPLSSINIDAEALSWRGPCGSLGAVQAGRDSSLAADFDPSRPCRYR